jgi:hypothetical protein
MRFQIIICSTLVAAIVFICSCRSQKNCIKNVYSFSFQKQEGTIKQKDGDNDFANADTFYVVYADVVTDEIQWDTAIINGSLYTIFPQYILSGKMEAGFDEKGMPVNIQVKNNRYLFQLQFEPVKGKIKIDPINSKENIIRYRYKGRDYLNNLKFPLFLHQRSPV